MFGYRRLVAFLIAGYLLLEFEGYSAQGEDNDSDYGDNETRYKETFRSGIEKVYQGLLDIGPSSPLKCLSKEIGEFISDLPQPLSTIVNNTENATKRELSDILNLFEKHFHAIFPGTLWCGAGNISKNGNLGIFNKTDACCRAHDKCPSDIDAGKTKGDLINNGAFTRSACSCDHQLYHCLKNANTVIADQIGWTYFDILGTQCFEFNYPITSCAKYAKHRILEKKCVKYNFDKSKNKTLIWVDNPVF